MKRAFPFLFVLKALVILPLLVFFSACGSKTDSTRSEVGMKDVLSEISKDMGNTAPSAGNIDKQVKVLDILTTERYHYLEVREDKGDKYWLAIAKQPVEKGDVIVYGDALLKKDFESKEFGRTFDTIYLVSKFQRYTLDQNPSNPQEQMVLLQDTPRESSHPQEDPVHKGLAAGEKTSIQAIMKNPGNYANQPVTISGQVYKVNYNIMSRNWVHIRDVNKPNGPELTITTTDKIMEGEMVTFTGVLRVDKDFGAGYRYDVILEDAIRQ